MSESKEGWIKFAITAAIGAITLIAGFIQFGSTSALSVRQPFIEIQTKLCLSAAENSGRLASTLDEQIWTKAREEFWMLYWGSLAMVEDVEAPSPQRVELAMMNFGAALKQLNTDKPRLPASSLEQPALAVAHACRSSLQSKWNVGLSRWFYSP